MLDQQLVRYSEGFLIGEKVCITTIAIFNLKKWDENIEKYVAENICLLIMLILKRK